MTTNASGNGSKSAPVKVQVSGKQLILIAAVVLLCASGMLLRQLPLATSPYPEMLDGIGEAAYAEDIAETGSLTPDADAAYSETHIIATPAYDAMTAMTSLIVGEGPLFLLQVMIAPFSIMLLLGIFVMTQRFSESNRVAVMALMALACYGPWLLITQATWKECIGLSLFPFILVTFFMRDNRSMRVISSALIFMMPFVHHYMALIVILMVSIASAISFLKANKMKRVRATNMLDLIVAIAAIDELILYYTMVKLDRLSYLTPENGLYLFFGLAILVSIAIYYLANRCITDAGKKAMWAVSFIVIVSIFSLNILAPTGLIDSKLYWAISFPVMISIFLIVAGVGGISLWAASFGRAKVLFFAMTAAPFVFIIHGVLRPPDVLSMDIITRTLDLIDISLMIGLGTAVIYLIKNWSKFRQALVVGMIGLLLLTTIPIAVDPHIYIGTRNDIYQYEVDAANWTTSERTDGHIQTDVHYWYLRYMFDGLDDSTLVRRIEGTTAILADQWMIANQRWTTTGTKDLPYGWVIIDPARFEAVLSESNIRYIGGPVGMEIIVFEAA